MRTVTNKVIELAENGILAWETIARECLQNMSEDDVADMARTCEWLDDEDDKDDNFVGKAHVKVISNGKEFLLDIDECASIDTLTIEHLRSYVSEALIGRGFIGEDELEDGIEIINEQSLCERLDINK